jgi:hypothetical protein
VAELLASEFGCRWRPDLTNVRITGDTLGIGAARCRRPHRLLPLAREGNKLRVAISDPLDTDGIDALGYS